MESLVAMLPPGAVSTDPTDLRAHARDWWALAMLRERRGDALDLPVAVVRPASTAEVASVLRWASDTGTPVVPFGGGSGVLGAAQAVPGCISLDLRRMDRVVEVDSESLTVCAQAGIMGPALEGALAGRGLTLGHFPQSIDISTLGGWLSARGAGQKSSGYGRIEDMLLGAEVALAGGRVVRTAVAPATAAGPDLARLFVGAEGTLGVICEATLRVRRAPREVRHAAFSFGEFSGGLAALAEVARSGLRPAVARLYDPADVSIAFRHYEARPEGALLVVRLEGERLLDAEERALRDLLGEGAAAPVDPAIAEFWWEHRNDAVGSYRKVMLEGMAGPTAVVDTLEIAVPWSRAGAAYGAVGDALRAHADHAGCHASHVYPQGACLYFTFLAAGSADDHVAEERWRAAWSAGMDAALASGASISHHHGVGLAKAPWAAREWGEGIEVLRAIKRALDPKGIMNPGKLGL